VTQLRVKIEMAVFAFHCFPKRIDIPADLQDQPSGAENRQPVQKAILAELVKRSDAL